MSDTGDTGRQCRPDISVKNQTLGLWKATVTPWLQQLTRILSTFLACPPHRALPCVHAAGVDSHMYTCIKIIIRILMRACTHGLALTQSLDKAKRSHNLRSLEEGVGLGKAIL